MKIIDQTPYFNQETGEIGIFDRLRAFMNFGAGWFKEMDAQKQVIAVLGKVLDRNYTLLRNVTPAGLETSFPLILIGPPGLYVMYVTPLTGMFRAKGDQWGTISGSAFKPEKPNLLTRTDRMARAIHVFLQRQGYTAMINVDPILLCSDPTFNVDSIRPIIRVVMRDALERFAISLAQSRVAFSSEAIQDILKRLLEPPKPVAPPVEILAAASPDGPPTEMPAVSPAPGLDSSESNRPLWATDPASPPQPAYPTPKRSRGMTRFQWGFLIFMFVFWGLLMAVFLFLVLKSTGVLP